MCLTEMMPGDQDGSTGNPWVFIQEWSSCSKHTVPEGKGTAPLGLHHVIISEAAILSS